MSSQLDVCLYDPFSTTTLPTHTADYQTIASHRRESDVSEAASTIYASMAEPMPQDADLGNRPRFSRTIRGAFCEREYNLTALQSSSLLHQHRQGQI
jgi:hypothetical protein